MLLVVQPQIAEARSFYYPDYRVTIEINEDSTFDVTERLTYLFTGEYRGVRAQIKLADPNRDQYCLQNGLTCGGIGRIALLGVFDAEGKQLSADQYSLYTEVDEDTEISYFTIERELWPDGREFDGTEPVVFEFKYRLYGSLGWINERPYFYWNALAEERGGQIKSGRVDIVFPKTPDLDLLEVYSSSTIYYDAAQQGKTITIEVENVPSVGDLTVAYDLSAIGISQPGKLTFTGRLPFWGLGAKLDGVDLGSGLEGELDGVPAGKHKVEFYFPGYVNQVNEIDVASGQVVHIDVSLQPEAGTLILIVLNVLLNLAGLVAIPFVGWFVYSKWRREGKDKDMPQTIIPLYSPPEGVAPYLLGSIKDEKVDFQDVTGSIIDLAYRGYIKIKEVTPNTNYSLHRQEPGAKAKPLNEIESQLMTDLFGDNDEVETKALGLTFALKYKMLEKKIYQEMVTKGYFTKSPEAIRNKFHGYGIGLFILGIAGVIGTGILGAATLGIPGPVLLGLALVVFGLGYLGVAPHMPAKTSLGSKTFADILGFKMYLHTAERFRLQKLGPDEFERYLSYAVVFGIEKEWAEKFKDIYTGQPEWLESSNVNTLTDIYWISRFSRGFSQSMTTSVMSSGSGSARGSGWTSGGGSFGGFSGGGGGGGSRGAF